MGYPSISIRVQRLKDIKKLKGQLRHDLRTGRIPKYVDTERTHLNSVLRQATAEQILKETQKIKQLRKGASPALAGILTFSHDAQEIINKLSFEEQDKLFLKAIEKFEQVVNTKVMNAVVHRDESAIHMHFIALPCELTGIPHSKGFLSRPENLSKLQDEIAEVFKHLGIGRGIKKTLRIEAGEPMHKWTHKSVRQLHKDLPFEIEQKRKELENLQKEIEQKQKVLENLKNEIEEIEKMKEFAYRITDAFLEKQREVEKLKKENEILKQKLQKLIEIQRRLSKNQQTKRDFPEPRLD